MSKTELVKSLKQSATSRVLETRAPEPEATQIHFLGKLQYETDPDDVYNDMENKVKGFVVVDTRKKESYDEAHVPGSISLPHRTISAETTRHLSKNDLIVVYCWGPGCNAATKAAVKLTGLGFKVKEMIGGIEYWKRDGFTLEGSRLESVQTR